jgi:hypothetical protein
MPDSTHHNGWWLGSWARDGRWVGKASRWLAGWLVQPCLPLIALSRSSASAWRRRSGIVASGIGTRSLFAPFSSSLLSASFFQRWHHPCTSTVPIVFVEFGWQHSLLRSAAAVACSGAGAWI